MAFNYCQISRRKKLTVLVLPECSGYCRGEREHVGGIVASYGVLDDEVTPCVLKLGDLPYFSAVLALKGLIGTYECSQYLKFLASL